jgi:hypothetical protein
MHVTLPNFARLMRGAVAAVPHSAAVPQVAARASHNAVAVAALVTLYTVTENASKQKGRPTVCASVPSVPNMEGQAGGSAGHVFAVQDRAHNLQQRQQQPPHRGSSGTSSNASISTAAGTSSQLSCVITVQLQHM